MNRPSSDGFRKWFWPIVIALLSALLVIWISSPKAEPPLAEPSPQQTPSAEWTTAPDEPGVPVNLPETPITNVPNEAATASQSAQGED